jgi:hypothetical protein
VTQSGPLVTVNASGGACQTAAVAVAALAAGINWPTTTPAAGMLGRVHAAVRSSAAAVNGSLVATATVLSAGIASTAAADTASAAALSAAVSTLQSRASTSEGAINTLSNSLTSQV